MNSKKTTLVWLIGICFLLSGTALAGEDFIKVSPSGEVRPGIIEITISGTRDPGKATILESRYSVEYPGEGMYGGVSVEVYATIGELETPPLPSASTEIDGDLILVPSNADPFNLREDPENTSYERKFSVYLGPPRGIALSDILSETALTEAMSGFTTMARTRLTTDV